MTPGQILLNNLIYDASQTAIPTDTVDPDVEAVPARWDVHAIERFMVLFGPISSIFDYVTFGLLLLLLGTSEDSASAFHAGWFIESLFTQILVVLAIRTRMSPFWRSRPSRPLAAAIVGALVVAVIVPLSPLGSVLGFGALPAQFWLLLVAIVAAYLDHGRDSEADLRPPRGQALGRRRRHPSSRPRRSRAGPLGSEGRPFGPLGAPPGRRGPNGEPPPTYAPLTKAGRPRCRRSR